jgi:hypothetical protein
MPSLLGLLLLLKMWWRRLVRPLPHRWIGILRLHELLVLLLLLLLLQRLLLLQLLPNLMSSRMLATVKPSSAIAPVARLLAGLCRKAITA